MKKQKKTNNRSNLFQHPQLQQPYYTEMLRNSSFTNAANFDIAL